MDFPGNSHSGKEGQTPKGEKHIEKVVTGDVIQKKKPFSKRLRDVFLGGDAHSVTSYIVAEVLLPTIRNLVVDATSKGVERLVYGDNPTRRPSYGRPGSSPRVSYHTPVNRQYGPQRANLPDQYRGRGREMTDFVLSSKEEADLILERIGDIIENFDCASLSDLHEMLGLPHSHVDNKWGWTDIRFAAIRQIREGWLLDLPPVEPI